MTDNVPPVPEWVPTFLAELAKSGIVKRSAIIAGVTTGTAYVRRNTNRLFAAQWNAALAGRNPAASPAPETTTQTGAEAADAPGRTTIGWRVRFLEALAETSNVTASAIRANVPIRTVYKARREEAAFAAKWREALHEGYDNLEMELLGHLRNAQPERKMDVAAAMRLLVAHRETVARERALREDDDEQAVLDSIDKFIDEMRDRRAANTAILAEPERDDGAE